MTGRHSAYSLPLLVTAIVVGCAVAAGAIDVPRAGGALRAGGYLDGLAVAETEGGPRQRPQALASLTLDGTPTRWFRGFLEVRGRIGGPFEGGSGICVYNFDDTFQNYTPSIEWSEAWAEAHTRRVDVRVGLQKIAWGKLDGIPPTDVVNPRDFHDPLVQGVEERKIGVPALVGTYFAPDVPSLALSQLRMTLVYVPLAVPSRLPLREERWFPSSISPSAGITVSRGLLAKAGFPASSDIVIPNDLETDNRRPPSGIEDGGVGLRLAGTWRNYDWDVYHYSGPETGPDAELRPELFLDSIQPLRIRSVTQLTQKHDVIHMTGFDAAFAVGGVTVRAEAAHFIDRPYLRQASDLITPAALARLPLKRITHQLFKRNRAPVMLGELFVPLDSVEWGIGADYLWHGWLPVVQVNQIAILEAVPRLLISDPETWFTGILRKRYLSDRLELELRGIYAIDRDSWLVFPRASYLVTDDLRVRIGYLAIGGPRASLIGQFNENDEVVLQARYVF